MARIAASAKLEKYRSMRDFSLTSEPSGGSPSAQGKLGFVIQQHAARRMHYDFRLELDGVLLSWSVPKGPSLSPATRRLAVRTEDHPLDYAGFEGIIPAGQYGGGSVIVWDRGTWTPEDDAQAAMAKGRLTFTLHGEKLAGRWHLVKTRGDGGKSETWLLFKGRDEAADDKLDIVATRPDSVLSGKTVEQVAAAPARVWQSNRATAPDDAPAAPASKPAKSSPAKSSTIDATVAKATNQVKPTRAATNAAQPTAAAKSPREKTIFAETGTAETRAAKARTAKASTAKAGAKTSTEKASTAKASTAKAGAKTSTAKASVETSTAKAGVKTSTAKAGAKTSGATPRAKTSGATTGAKISAAKPATETGTAKAGSAEAGSAEAGAAKAGIATTGAKISAAKPATETGTAKAEIAKTGAKTSAAKAGAAKAGAATAGAAKAAGSRAASAGAAVAGQTQAGPATKLATLALVEQLPLGFKLTSLDRVLYPDQGVTKGELIAYLAVVAEHALPHLARRPLTLVRCPEGLGGQARGRGKACFFQKHRLPGAPPSIEAVAIDEEDGETVQYMQVHDMAGLVALAQLGSLEVHTWGCHADHIDQPDLMVFDLDPDVGLGWDRVALGAFELRRRLNDAGLESFVKTTGGKGLHVVAPITRGVGWDDFKAFTKAMVETLERDDPDHYTTNISKAKRKGKIFLDYLRNGRGATFVAPYSPRARPGAPVAVPIDWEELARGVDPATFTMTTVPKRLATLSDDPWKTIGHRKQSITASAWRAVGGKPA